MSIINSEISFFRNESDDYITSYFINIINNISYNYNILYISYNYSKNVLLSKFNCLDKNNVTIIDDLTLDFSNIDEKIIKYKPKYILIDHLNLTKPKRIFYVNEMKLKDLRSKVEELESKYDVKFIIVINNRVGSK